MIPLKVLMGHTPPHLKGLRYGKYESRGLSCGWTYSICQDVMKSDNLLHKWGFVDSLSQATHSARILDLILRFLFKCSSSKSLSNEVARKLRFFS